MQFNVSSLLKEHTGATRDYAIDDDIVIEGERHHLTGQARLDRTPRGLLVRASMAGTAACECSRCLRQLSCPVELVVEEEYLPTVDIDTGARVEIDEGEEEAYRISSRHVLDLSEAVRQYWAMALPMAPVCSEDCRGLCPICGEELSRAGHDCGNDATDARWAKLAQLRLR